MGLRIELSRDWIECLGVEFKGKFWKIGLSFGRWGLMMDLGGDWVEGGVGVRIGLSVLGWCLRGRCCVGS